MDWAAHPRYSSLRVSSARLLDSVSKLSGIGGEEDGGVTRLGLTTVESEAREYLSQAARESGLVSRVDEAANLIVSRFETTDKRMVLFGSHLDTVRSGGRLDGAYGVAAALEVLRVISENDIHCTHEPVVIAFANEEGGDVQYPFWGSKAITGTTDPSGMPEAERHRLQAALDAVGGDFKNIGSAAWDPSTVIAFLELHIEQGPRLEELDIPIGVVEGIVGRTILEMRIRGDQGHAGTTPMKYRRDALAAAAEVVLLVERLAGDLGFCSTATTGRIHVTPNATNVVPGEATLSVELRDHSFDAMRRARDTLMDEIARIEAGRGVTVDVTELPAANPTEMDGSIRASIRRAAESLDHPYIGIDSGAGHDAQVMAQSVPTGMIFVPSQNGISHHPAENTADQHLCLGGDVLLHAVLQLLA